MESKLFDCFFSSFFLAKNSYGILLDFQPRRDVGCSIHRFDKLQNQQIRSKRAFISRMIIRQFAPSKLFTPHSQQRIYKKNIILKKRKEKK